MNCLTSMDALTLNCPMCGAPTTTEAPNCEHCGARLATVACPSCFGMIFTGSKFCPHCGAKVERAEVETGPEEARPCPRCHEPLGKIELGPTHALECPKCSGLWVDAATFNAICADREKQAAVVGENVEPLPALTPEDFSLDEVRYVPCPCCKQLMNRINFAHESGVILDVCKQHGFWFDQNELRRIVEFIRGGGLEASRERDIQKWKEEGWKANMKSRDNSPGAGLYLPPVGSPDTGDVFDVASVTWEIVKFIGKLLLK